MISPVFRYSRLILICAFASIPARAGAEAASATDPASVADAPASDTISGSAAASLGEEDPDPAPLATSKGRSTVDANQRRSAGREKDTDGTEAPNRFQGSPVLRSQYEQNGQPLEVDPD